VESAQVIVVFSNCKRNQHKQDTIFTAGDIF